MSLGVGPIPTWVNAMATSFHWLTAPPNAKATRASARAALAATPQSSGRTTQSPPGLNSKEGAQPKETSKGGSWLSFAFCWQQEDEGECTKVESASEAH
jgi:hypothetical protein